MMFCITLSKSFRRVIFKNFSLLKVSKLTLMECIPAALKSVMNSFTFVALVVLFFSMRRNGKSLGQMVREEIGTVGGIAALIAVFSIMIIILAVLALVVVNALTKSPWGVFSIGLTIPIALFMGYYLRYLRPGRVMEVTAI